MKNLTKRSFLGMFTFIPAALAATSAQPQTGVSSNSSWFIQGNAQGDLLMIDMSTVTAVLQHATDWVDRETGNALAGEVQMNGNTVLLGRDLMKHFVQQYGAFLASQQNTPRSDQR